MGASTPGGNTRLANARTMAVTGQPMDPNTPVPGVDGAPLARASSSAAPTRALPPSAMQQGQWSSASSGRTGNGGTASTILTGGGVLTPDQAPRRKMLLGA